MTLISEREPSPPEQMLSQSTWKPTGANLIQRGLVQDIVEIPKGPKNKEHVQKTETGICSSKRSSTKYWSKDETQFVIEGIESLKKRHTLLDQSFPLGKPWFFALQEIAAILRTPFVYDYSPHISDRNGHTIQLKTDFKVFRLREPLSKKQGKELITKKAVLYVIGGPFFFKQATPALNEFCRVNGLARPIYSPGPNPDGTFGCSVRVGQVANTFVDNEECWENVVDAIEDVAKLAMNALYREGVSMEIERIPNAIPVATQPHNESKESNKRKAPMSSPVDEVRRVCARIKEATGAHTRNLGAPTGPRLGTGNPRVNTAEPGFRHNGQKSSQSRSWSARSSSRTRAGLMRCLSEISQPQERVDAMCDYLKIQEPEYWTKRHSFGALWFGRFLTEQPTSKTGHTLIAPTVVRSFIGLQDCAKMVERSLFEKIYSHEIHLEDGHAVVPDRALQNHQSHQAHLHPRQKRPLEKDERLPLTTITKRHELPVKPGHLSMSAKAVPLKVTERPLLQASRKDEDPSHASETNIYTHAMTRAHSDTRATARSQLNVSDITQGQKARQAVTAPTIVAGEGGSTPSKQLITGNKITQRPEAINNANRVEQANKPKDPRTNPYFVVSGQHSYVNPPPFLETTTPHIATKIAPLPPLLKLKSEAQRDESDDDEVIYVGQRTIRDVGGFVKGDLKGFVKGGVKGELEEGEIL